MTVPEGFEDYLDTVLHYPSDLRVDLRAPFGPGDHEKLAKVVPFSPFAVVTAANPGGHSAGAKKNERRHARLIEELSRAGTEWVPVQGCSPDGVHCEESVCVDLPRQDAADLARGFDQDAIFWYDGREFWLVDARPGEEWDLRLPGDWDPSRSRKHTGEPADD